MATKKVKQKKKFFTIEEANAALPLVRAIVRDITTLARDLRDRHERCQHAALGERSSLGPAYQEELEHVQAEMERDRLRMQEYEDELRTLGIELKDYYTGLIDFPCWMNEREVYLCWRLGEPEVAHWHELDSGFAGRQKLKVRGTISPHP